MPIFWGMQGRVQPSSHWAMQWWCGGDAVVLSHPSAEAHGGRSEASSHICVVMVNFHPGTGKPWRFPKISQALCGCWAFLGSEMEWVSVGTCPHTDRVWGTALVQLEMPP